MISIKNLKFKTKLRVSYIILGAICTAVIGNDLYQMFKINDYKDQIYADYIAPSNEVDKIYREFEGLKNTLLKFSIPSFEPELNSNLTKLSKSKEVIDSALANLTQKYAGTSIEEDLTSINKSWSDYKSLVIDGTISAAAIKDYELAAVVATTSGEEIGEQILSNFKNLKDNLTQKGEALNSNLSDAVSSSRLVIFFGIAFGTVFFFFVFFYMVKSLMKPVQYMKDVVGKFSVGNFKDKVAVATKDEFGELADMLEQLRHSQHEKIKAATEISRGNLSVEIKTLSEDDELSDSMLKMIGNLRNLIDELKSITDEIIEGKVTKRGNPEKFDGAYKEIVAGVNATLDALFTPIKVSVDVLAEMAKGNFDARVKGDFKGDHKLIVNSINSLGESLTDILSNIAEMVNLTASISEQISSSTEQMAAGAQEQTAQANEVVLQVEEMTKTIMSTSKNATLASEASRKAGQVAREGGEVVNKTVEGMNKIADFVVNAAGKIQNLGKNSEQIGEIVQVIDDIANQTNLLALNAAIEAARAGEQGRGFAVVADEVRKLAERTTKATKEISDMIKRIQDVTENVVVSMSEGKGEVETGKELAQKAGKSLEEIIQASDAVLDVVNQVAAASEEQSATSEQINRNVETISKVTNESAAGIQQIAGAADELNRMTNNLRELIAKFKFAANGEFKPHGNGDGKSKQISRKEDKLLTN
ncbi:MAG: HAMP domain-containing methyl-accepting chemotaxis protein [Melioribacter sp.]|uniref:HAMP domain-containing methyl-accepting chemotaxis protein n=1 Tax=Melioribacter sp. TaxID=2052167 RepID=UPI003BBAABF0